METNKIYEVEKVENFKELLNRTVKKYPNNIAYKYKKDYEVKKPEYTEKTYTELKQDILNLGTALLDLKLKNKKIAIISNNRYEWCTSYLAITTSNLIVVPLDKALQEKEIEKLIIRSGAEAVIYEEKYQKIFENIKQNKESSLKYYINIDLEKSNKEETSYKELLKKGKQSVEKGNSEYENQRIEDRKNVNNVIYIRNNSRAKSSNVITKKHM